MLSYESLTTFYFSSTILFNSPRASISSQEVLPVARRLAERVLENCASKLKPYLTQAVENLGMSLDDYSSVVASICQATPAAVEQNDAATDKRVVIISLVPEPKLRKFRNFFLFEGNYLVILCIDSVCISALHCLQIDYVLLDYLRFKAFYLLCVLHFFIDLFVCLIFSILLFKISFKSWQVFALC